MLLRIDCTLFSCHDAVCVLIKVAPGLLILSGAILILICLICLIGNVLEASQAVC